MIFGQHVWGYFDPEGGAHLWDQGGAEGSGHRVRQLSLPKCMTEQVRTAEVHPVPYLSV